MLPGGIKRFTVQSPCWSSLLEVRALVEGFDGVLLVSGPMSLVLKFCGVLDKFNAIIISPALNLPVF